MLRRLLPLVGFSFLAVGCTRTAHIQTTVRTPILAPAPAIVSRTVRSNTNQPSTELNVVSDDERRAAMRRFQEDVSRQQRLTTEQASERQWRERWRARWSAQSEVVTSKVGGVRELSPRRLTTSR